MSHTRLPLLTLILAAVALAAPDARAQVDPGSRLRIVQDGVEAGQVLVPRDQDLCRYVEYWYVYEGFEFVSVRSGARFSVDVTDEDGDVGRFLDEMWTKHPDGRLLTSISTETRPGCP